MRLLHLIEPLRLQLPKDVKLLDATILHVHPQERAVNIDTKIENENGGEITFIEFKFPLLNKVKKSEHDLAENAVRQLVAICPYCWREAPEVLPRTGFAGGHLLSDEL